MLKAQVYSQRGGEWEDFNFPSSSDEFDGDQSDEIEAGATNSSQINKHAYMIDASEEHAIIQHSGIEKMN